MAPLTLYLGKLLGGFCILIGLVILVDRARFLRLVDGLLRDEALMFVTALVTVAGGLAMVLGHNRWSGGALPIVVTLVGWLSFAKGAALLLLPRASFSRFYAAVQYERRLPLLGGLALALGLYLALASFFA